MGNPCVDNQTQDISGSGDDDESDTLIFDFLPFGIKYGDVTLTDVDDGSSEEIVLATDAVIFGSIQDRLFVSA